MDCSEPCVFNEKVEWYEGRGFWFEYPVVEYCGGRGGWVVKYSAEMMRDTDGDVGRESSAAYPSLSAIFDVEGRDLSGEGRFYEEFITATLRRLAAQGQRFGALMIEPVVLGAGGMLLV
jgi:dethiobiotin synthetase/adenosylmethionine--8-amino-7-oxononanoate aminotransferase